MFANVLFFDMRELSRLPSTHYCQLPFLSNEHISQDVDLEMNFFIFQRQSVLLVPPPPFSDVLLEMKRAFSAVVSFPSLFLSNRRWLSCRRLQQGYQTRDRNL